MKHYPLYLFFRKGIDAFGQTLYSPTLRCSFFFQKNKDTRLYSYRLHVVDTKKMLCAMQVGEHIAFIYAKRIQREVQGGREGGRARAGEEGCRLPWIDPTCSFGLPQGPTRFFQDGLGVAGQVIGVFLQMSWRRLTGVRGPASSSRRGRTWWKLLEAPAIFAKERVAFRDGNCVVSLYADERNGKICQLFKQQKVWFSYIGRWIGKR